MKKIFMASLVAMMAVTTANAQIASTEYTDATFVAKDGFDALVGGTTQVTANKSAIATINGRVGNITKENMGTEAGTVVEAIKEVVTEKADKATTYTKDEADAEFMTSAEVTDAISNATSADSAQVAANKASIEGMKSDIQGLHNSKQFKSTADYQMGNSKGEWTTMTQKQQNALNSGVTSATVTQVATNKTDIADLQVGKVDKNQTAANAKKAMVTDDKGDVVPGLITEGMISGNAVTTDKIQDRAVGGTKIADSGVATRNIADDAIVTSKILDANVTTAKIADNAVTTAKIADANVTTAKIADDAVTTAKIAGNAVMLDHLNSEVKAVLGDGVNAMEAIEGMNSETTGAGPIVKSVTQTEGKVTVGLGYIETADINKVAVTTEKIADNAVTTAKILDASVTKAKLDASVKATLDKADNAMQETGLKALPSWADQKCGDTNVTCSLVSKNGVIAWEAVKY